MERGEMRVRMLGVALLLIAAAGGTHSSAGHPPLPLATPRAREAGPTMPAWVMPRPGGLRLPGCRGRGSVCLRGLQRLRPPLAPRKPAAPPTATGAGTGDASWDNPVPIDLAPTGQRERGAGAAGAGAAERPREARMDLTGPFLYLPNNMGEYRDLEAFLAKLEEVLGSEDARGGLEPKPGASAAALSHMKRLQGQQTSPELRKRFQNMFNTFTDKAERDLRGMRLSQLAQLLNALSHQNWGPPGRFRGVASKACGHVTNIVSGEDYTEGGGRHGRPWGGENVATLAMLCNAVAKFEIRDEAVVEGLARVVGGMCACNDVSSLNAALFMNAFSRLRYQKGDLYVAVGKKVMQLDAEEFRGPGGAQDLSNIANAYSKHGGPNKFFYEHLAEIAHALDAQNVQFGAQAIGNVLNAFVRLGEEECVLLLPAMERAILRTHPREFDAQSVGLIINAVSRRGQWRPREVINHLVRAVLLVPCHKWNSQSIGITVNALTRLQVTHSDAYLHLATAACALNPKEFDMQGASNMAHAFSRAHVRAVTDGDGGVGGLNARLVDVCMAFPQDAFTAQSLATLSRAFVTWKATAVHRRDALLERLGQVVQGMPVTAFSTQAAAIIVGAFAEALPRADITKDVLKFLSQVLLSMKQEDITSIRSIAYVVDGYARANRTDAALITHMCACAQQLPLGAFRPVLIRLIAKGLLDLGCAGREGGVMAHLSRAAQMIQQTDPEHQAPATVNEYSATDVALIAFAYAKAGHKDEMLFWHLSAVAQQLPYEAWAPSDLAHLADALSSAGHKDASLYRYLSKVAVSIPTEHYEEHDAACLITALARAEVRDALLFGHLSTACKPDAQALIFTSTPGKESRDWVSGLGRMREVTGEWTVSNGTLWLPGSGDLDHELYTQFGRNASDFENLSRGN